MANAARFSSGKRSWLLVGGVSVGCRKLQLLVVVLVVRAWEPKRKLKEVSWISGMASRQGQELAFNT